MTALLTEAEASGGETRPKRRWPVLLVALVTLIAGLGVTWFVYARTYSPLQLGGSSGPLTKSLKVETDGQTFFQYLLVGPPGTKGTSYFQLTNSGRFTVRLDGLGSPDPTSRLSLNWAPAGRFEGQPHASRDFPVSLKHGQSIFVLMSQYAPDCKQVGSRTITGISLRWSALGAHHKLQIPLPVGGNPLPIVPCPSKQMLRFTL